MLPETPYIPTAQLQHQVAHEIGAIQHIFYTNQIHGGSSADYSFIHFVAPCACSSSSGSNITSNLSVWRFEHVKHHIHLSVVFPSRMPAGPHFVTQPILLGRNIPNIWHKSSTKHKEVRPDWNDKNDNANYAPSYHMEGFTNGSGYILKKYSIKCEKI